VAIYAQRQNTRRMYWRRASIQDDQACRSAWWRHYSETVSAIISLLFSL